MLKLTLEAIRKHPWYVLTSELPREPSEALLMSAVLAAWYCRESESLFTLALRDGDFVPMFCESSDEIPDYIEGSKELSLRRSERSAICSKTKSINPLDEGSNHCLWNEVSRMAKSAKHKWLRWKKDNWRFNLGRG